MQYHGRALGHAAALAAGQVQSKRARSASEVSDRRQTRSPTFAIRAPSSAPGSARAHSAAVRRNGAARPPRSLGPKAATDGTSDGASRRAKSSMQQTVARAARIGQPRTPPSPSRGPLLQPGCPTRALASSWMPCWRRGERAVAVADAGPRPRRRSRIDHAAGGRDGSAAKSARPVPQVLWFGRVRAARSVNQTLGKAAGASSCAAGAAGSNSILPRRPIAAASRCTAPTAPAPISSASCHLSAAPAPSGLVAHGASRRVQRGLGTTRRGQPRRTHDGSAPTTERPSRRRAGASRMRGRTSAICSQANGKRGKGCETADVSSAGGRAPVLVVV